MKCILAKDVITDSDIKNYLDEVALELDEKIKQVINLDNSVVKEGMKDAYSLLDYCRRISKKIESFSPLSADEAERLKEILLSTKKNINLGIIEGVTTGIDSYLNTHF